jgi:hypothetical protein
MKMYWVKYFRGFVLGSKIGCYILLQFVIARSKATWQSRISENAWIAALPPVTRNDEF